VTYADIVPATDAPRTRQSLAADLQALGVRPGSVLLVHASLAALGWVCGGVVPVVQALRDAVGDEGTVVVPTHTSENSDPAEWRNPPVPEAWWPVIRDHMPGFDPRLTPSRGMGAVAEAFRTSPGAYRSEHPVTSFAAVGPAAERIVSGHRLDDGLGESSPLGRIYELDGDVLLLGVGHGSNTSLHLAEYRVDTPPRTRNGAAVSTADGGRVWTWWEDVAVDEDDFERLGADLDATGAVTFGRVGSAECRLMRQRAAVDYAVGWLGANRGNP
jgi:aminoglycoside 3-N-acetyltransferase